MKRNILHYLGITLPLLITSFSFAAGETAPWQIKNEPQKCFIENKGQFYIPGSEEPVLYAYDGGSTRIYFTAKGVTFSLLKTWPKEKEDRLKKLERKIQYAERPMDWMDIKRKEKLNYETDVICYEWENASSAMELVAEQKTSNYFSYTKVSAQGDLTNENHIAGYEKIIYKNLYPGIDVAYTFHPDEGIKYEVTLHPGADPSLLKMKYDGKNALSLIKGDLNIETKFGKMIDHAPVTFYKGNDHHIISSGFVQDGNTVFFEIGDYDKTRTVVIDPWTQTPAFATDWDCVWECDKDATGNVYLIGGVMPLQLKKYNSAGVLQWTYNTPYDTTSWLGTMATDNLGNSYVTQGSVAKILKVNSAGGLVWSNNSPGGIFGSTEFWSISFNCDQTMLVIGGTGGFVPPLPYIYNVDVATGNMSASQQVTGSAAFPITATQEVRSIASCVNGKYYYLSNDSVGYIHQNFSFCTSGSSSAEYHKVSSYDLGYKCEDWRKNNTGISAIRANGNYVYTHKGNTVDRRDLTTLNILSSAPVPGGGYASSFGSNYVQNSGIDIDACGNVYVGSKNAVIKYDANLVQLASYPTSFNVYDVHVSAGGDIIACGSTGDYNTGIRTGYIQSIAATACAIIATTCCDATICSPAALCVSSAPVTLQAATPGGVWSGTGVNAAGVFNPATAGVGTFTISYTLACGTGTVSITVNPCTALSLCQGAGSTATVSGGSGPYSWQQQVTTTPCVTGAGTCAGPFSFTVAGPPVTTWSTFATGTTVTLPGTYPIQVVDGSGTIITITNAAAYAALPPCSGCPTISSSTSSVVNVACFGASTGSFNASASGGSSPYDYTLMNGATTVATFTNIPGTQAFTGLPAGTYTLNILDNNGCPSTVTITITQPASALTASITSQTNVLCFGGSTGAATVTGSGGTVGGGYSYSWAPSGGSAASASTLPANTYTVTITDANSCTVTQSVIITQPASALSASITTFTDSGCGGSTGSATAQAAGGTSPWDYVWTGSTGTLLTTNNITTSNTLSGLAAGTYTITVTDANNCTATNTVTISNTGAPALAITAQTNVLCFGAATGAATASASGGSSPYDYVWTGSAGTLQTTLNVSVPDNISGLAAGTYTVTVTDNAGCVTAFSFTISQPAAALSTTVSSQTNVLCFGGSTGSATVTAGGGTIGSGYSYSWAPSGGSTATASGLSANTYTVTVTDANSCTITQAVTITQPTAALTATVTSQTNVLCFGGSTGSATVTGNGGTPGPGYTYSWTPSGGSASTATGLSANSYTVTVTDANSCTTTQTVVITEPASALAVSITGTTASPCGSATGTATAQASGGSGPFDYVWTGTAGTLQTTNDISGPDLLSGLSAGSYTVTVSDNNGCTSSAIAVVSNIGGASVSITAQTNVLCFGGLTGSATASASGGASPYDYIWTGSTGVLQTTMDITSPNTLSGLAAGTYTISVTDNAGCITSIPVTISQPFAPLSITLINSVNASCGNNNGSALVSAGGGTIGTGYSYSWAPSGGSAAAATGLGANTYTVTAIDANGCSSTLAVPISSTGGPAASIASQTDVSCFGDNTGSATVTATGGSGTYTYSWSGGAGSSATASGLVAGSYTVTVNDGLCSNTAVVTITQPSAISLTVSTTPATCGTSNGSATVSSGGGTGPFTYTWSPGGLSTSTINGLGAGNYSVTATDALGCVQSASGTVTTTGAITAAASMDTVISLGEQVQLNASGGTSYVWSPGNGLSCTTCASPMASPMQSTTYCVLADDAGCTDTACVRIEVIIPCPTNSDLAVPNAFSPNSDGHNDIFCLRGWGACVTDFSIFIYDRWGEKVFESRDPDFCWDGSYKGQPMDPGVFVYFITANFSSIKDKVETKGNISLIR